MTDPVFVTIRIGEDVLGIAATEDAPEGTAGQRFEMWVYAEDCAERSPNRSGIEKRQSPSRT